MKGNTRVIARSQHASWQSSCSALSSSVQKALVMATLIATTTASAVQAVSQDVVCEKNNRNLAISVNGSSRYFNVRKSKESEDFYCQITVTPASAEQQSPLRLVRLEGLRLEMDRAKCSWKNEVFLLQLEPSMLATFCGSAPFRELLLWTNIPFTLHYNFPSWSSTNPYGFSLSEDANATNVCGLGNTALPLRVEHTMYVFATNSLFKNVPPNDVACSRQEYTVTLEAWSPSKTLTLIVLDAPPSISCWTLLLNGQLYSNGNILSTKAGSNVTLRYVTCSVLRVNCQRGCINIEGFTLAAVLADAQQNSCSNAEVTAIAAGSVAAASLVAIAIAFIGKVLVRRHRRATTGQPPSSSAPSEHVSQSVAAAVLSRNEEIPMCDNDFYDVTLAT